MPSPCLLCFNVANVLQLKASFLSSLLDWAVSFVPNFSSSNLVDFVYFFDSRWLLLLYTFRVHELFFFFNKLLFIKEKSFDVACFNNV
jgi:hypothetical protein